MQPICCFTSAEDEQLASLLNFPDKKKCLNNQIEKNQ